MSWTPEFCLYHGPECLDGFGAAWAVHSAFVDAVEYVPVNHGVPIPIDVTGKHVLMVDFTLKPEPLRELAGKAASLFVLDHHKTAEAELREWTIVSFCLAKAREDLVIHFERARSLRGLPMVAYFDVAKSGAQLAWEFCFPAERDVPALIRHIEDYDLWRLAIPRTREVCAALASYPKDFAIWDGFAADVSGLLIEGKHILRARRELVRDMTAHAYFQQIGDYQVPTLNVPYMFASDCAEELLERYPNAPFVAAWFRRGEGKLQFSLRSEDHRTDVSEIAARFGGGGHRNASGFQTDEMPD